MSPRSTRVMKQLAVWLLALTALAFVAYAVPVRDACRPRDTEGAPRIAAVPTTFEGHTCTLHGSPQRTLDAHDCARLVCEPGVLSIARGAEAGWLPVLLVLYLGGTLAWSLRWRILLRLAGVTAALGSVWRITLESQAGGVLLPGGIGGDALRLAFALRQPRVEGAKPEAAPILASVLLDRVVGLVSLTALSAALVLVLGGADLRRDVGPALTFVAAVPCAFVAGLLVARAVHRGLARTSVRDARLGRLVMPLLDYVASPGAPGAIARAVLVSLVVSGVQLATVRGLVQALTPAASMAGGTIDERWVFVGTTLTFLVGALPGLPGGWGTTDAAFVFFLGRAGVAASAALAVSLTYRLLWYASAAMGAALLVSRASRVSRLSGGPRMRDDRDGHHGHHDSPAPAPAREPAAPTRESGA